MVLSSVSLAKYIACEVVATTDGCVRVLASPIMFCRVSQHVYRVLFLCPLLAVWLFVSSPGFAQQTTNTPASDQPNGTATPKSAAPPSPTSSSPVRGVKPGAEDVVQVIGPDGKPLFIPHGETWDEFQKFLRSRQANNGPMAPPFSVTGISFEGSAEANEDTVTLDATLSISVNRDDEDVLVPLRLTDTTLLKKPIHVGPNEAEFDVFDREEGYRCWLRGKGQHELKLSLAVRIYKQAASRRLTLRLPETPTSAIKLSVPLPKVSAKGLERGSIKTKPLENGRTEIQAFGPPGSLLDLSWQSVTDVTVKQELQALTLIVADLRAESLVLEATQQVRSIQGTFDKFTVRLPPEFKFVEVSGREVKESSKVSDSPTRIAVTLSAPTAGPVELKWILSAQIAPKATTLPTLEGFEVEDAPQQKGHVVVVAWEGVNLRKRDGEDRFVKSDTLAVLRDVPGFHAAANGSSTTVYSFLKQPFRMVLDVQKIEPYFTAETLHLVRLSPTRAELDTTLTVRVFRGSLADLVLPWPTFKSEGWEAISNDTPQLVEQILVEETPNGPQLRVKFLQPKSATSTSASGDVKSLIEKATAAFQQGQSEPALQILTDAIKRTDNEFEIRLTTRRPISSDSSAFDLSLPFVASSGQPASRVIVAPRSNLEVEWTPKNQALARPTTPDKKTLDQLESTRNVAAWRWDAGSPTFTAKAKVQQQSVTTDSLSELAFDTRQVTVSQRIAYDVAFEPLSQVRLMVPRAISDRVRFRLRDSTGQTKPLPPPVFTALEIDQSRQCRLSLDPPQVGKFEVLAEFDVEHTSNMTSNEPSQVNIPVLQSSDAEFDATRVKWNIGETQVASLDDPTTWSPELGDNKTSSWKTNGAKTAIVMKIAAASDSALQDFTVHRALIRTVVSEGRRHSQALFELDRDVREITLTLPPELSSQQFRAWWNHVAVSVEPINRNQMEKAVEIRLRRPASRDTNPSSAEAADGNDKLKETLWLDYYSEELTHFGWSNQFQLVTPQFASTVWVAQTIWQVVLPADQHLLTTPHDYATQFHWQRSLLLWSRQPNFGYDRIDRVLNGATPNKSDSLLWESSLTGGSADHNVYPVSCFGPPQPLVFWSMSRSAVVGCGAGLALLLGFVLIRIPATRHVLTFLVVGFLMSLAALWFAEPVKVLLQPAILGAAMAVIAAVIDRVGRSQPQSPMVTLSSPSDFFAASGSGVRLANVQAIADTSTSPPQVVLQSEPISASGSASGGRP